MCGNEGYGVCCNINEHYFIQSNRLCQGWICIYAE